MRVLLDTCIFIHLATDKEMLSKDVLSVIDDYDNTLSVSAETIRELIIQFNNGKLVSKFWKTADEMVDSIKNDYYISILPLKEEHMRTYSNLRINTAQDHKDPSDHVIIAHAITEHLPLITEDSKFEFYKNQGLDLILNKK
jgi:PIN domain nuclease of toxin-antitoxin system